VANVAHGLGHGLIGAAVTAWLAITPIGSCELLTMVTHNSQVPLTDTSETGHDADPLQEGAAELCSRDISPQTEFPRCGRSALSSKSASLERNAYVGYPPLKILNMCSSVQPCQNWMF
jgi:hypothetical protein